MRFIIWDPRDGLPRREESGEFVSDGLIGRVGAENCYVRVYAQYPEGSPAPTDLEVGQCIGGVRFSLSGSVGYYDVYRVA